MHNKYTKTNFSIGKNVFEIVGHLPYFLLSNVQYISYLVVVTSILTLVIYNSGLRINRLII